MLSNNLGSDSQNERHGLDPLILNNNRTPIVSGMEVYADVV